MGWLKIARANRSLSKAPNPAGVSTKGDFWVSLMMVFEAVLGSMVVGALIWLIYQTVVNFWPT